MSETKTISSNDYKQVKRERPMIGGCIAANEGEVAVKQYEIAKLRSPLKLAKAPGRMFVTNKRLIFYAPGVSITGKTTLQYEFNIAEVGGVEIRKDCRFGFIYFLLTLLLCSAVGSIFGGISFAIANAITDLTGIIAYSAILFLIAVIAIIASIYCIKKKNRLLSCIISSISAGWCFGADVPVMLVSQPLFYILLVSGVISFVVSLIALILRSFKTNLVIKIKTKGAGGAIEICRKKDMGLFAVLFGHFNSEAEEYTGYSYVMPSTDTESAIKYLGAIIHDIQTLGDYGVEKWTNSAKVKSSNSATSIPQTAENNASYMEKAAQTLSIKLLIPMEEADVLADKLMNIRPNMLPYAKKWLDGGNPPIVQMTIDGRTITTKMVMETDKCSYPEALIRMDYLVKNPSYIADYVLPRID